MIPCIHRRLLVGTALLLSSGCLKTTEPDAVEAKDGVSGTVLINVGKWNPGNGFLIDREERLILTSQRVIGERTDHEVIFPAVENGKVLTKRTTLISRATKLEAKALSSDASHGVAIIQLKKPAPDSATELKLATGEPARGAEVEFLGAPAKSNLVWTLTIANVEGVAEKEFALEGKKKAKARLIELSAEGAVAKEVSGGPVLNEKTEVIGIIADEPAQTGPLVCIDIAEVKPALCEVFRKLNTEALEKHKYEKALAYGDRAIGYYKGNALAWNERGVAYSMKDQFAKAAADYTEALKLDPKFLGALRNRASAYLHLGKYKEAVEDCTKAIDLSPMFRPAYEIRLKAYVKLNQKKEADIDARLIQALGGSSDWKVTGSAAPRPPE
jgi:tetratricopeptide (TPR) repeat protein